MRSAPGSELRLHLEQGMAGDGSVKVIRWYVTACDGGATGGVVLTEHLALGYWD